MEVKLANPRGFCAGVDRAIEIVEKALEIHGAPVYVLHEIVHNRYVVDDLARRGVRFVDELADVPAGSVTIFSAHGVSDVVVRTAQERGLRIIDATCPLVTKVHVQAQRYSGLGHGFERVDEVHAAPAQVLEDVLVVHDLVQHEHGCAVQLERALEDLDRAVDAGAEPARRGQDHLFDRPGHQSTPISCTSNVTG